MGCSNREARVSAGAGVQRRDVDLWRRAARAGWPAPNAVAGEGWDEQSRR